ncbi:uncharacterized protein LOC115797391 isoform X2 [Archocentrus centrarchus]|uniref:uncharacterized protein LOC115797391 isoform X2 n=1 Tax=Archocentrus centrarchus TaxID=63155 RepID=UPI0011E9D04D|nr:uncharacterized protein LOC115797391 isoform X2 [Archocentrus centrarchus]
MKQWSRLCFLVLVVSPICLGTNATNTQGNKGSLNTPTPTPFLQGDSKDLGPSVNLTLEETTNTTAEGVVPNNVTQAEETTTQAATSPTEVKRSVHTSSSPTTPTPSSPTTVVPATGSSAGYVVLVLIIIMIIALCVILYLLRRASRTYSFDLQRPSPANHLNQPTGTFEQVYLDDLERPAPKDIAATDDLSHPPVANGTSLHSEEKDSTGETAPEEQPEANGVETSPTDNTTPSLSSDEGDKTSDPPSSTNLFFDAIEEQQNENNNNPISSSDPFVEISLDEPAWCDQLLNSSEAPSSVLPFSPFSLSSSSS